MSTKTEQLNLITEMKDEIRSIRSHISKFNILIEYAGYTDDIIDISKFDDLQHSLSNEYNWLDI